MVPYYPDFFNDVFGPVMQPGSSSHTAGPCRLGFLARCLLEGPLQSIEIELDENGSFAGTFGLMREDLGMLSGAYGLLPDDAGMFEIKEILQSEGIRYSFRFIPFPPDTHPNAVRFRLTGQNGDCVTLQGNSTGGGRIETTSVCGIPIRFLGDSFLTICEAGIEDALRENNLLFQVLQDANGRSVLPVFHDAPKILRAAPQARVLFRLKPVLPVMAGEQRQPQLFRSMTEWIAYAAQNGISLSDAAVEYEKRASGLTKQQILARMEKLRALMFRQTQAVYDSESALLEDPFSGYHFRDWRGYMTERTPLAGPVTALALRYAFGVQALQKGVKLVPGPMGTGGGYLFAAVRAVQETRQIPDEKVLEGLLVAAGVGAVCYSRTDPTGEVIGCTGECGVCGAMAAAAVTYMCGGTPQQTEAAASLMLQAAFGWPCDPVPGGKNQPCISRVLTAVVMSITFADLALSGKEALLPFHEAVDVADRIGRKLPAALRCTSCGGACKAPAAKACKADFQQWFLAEKQE